MMRETRDEKLARLVPEFEKCLELVESLAERYRRMIAILSPQEPEVPICDAYGCREALNTARESGGRYWCKNCGAFRAPRKAPEQETEGGDVGCKGCTHIPVSRWGHAPCEGCSRNHVRRYRGKTDKWDAPPSPPPVPDETDLVQEPAPSQAPQPEAGECEHHVAAGEDDSLCELLHQGQPCLYAADDDKRYCPIRALADERDHYRDVAQGITEKQGAEGECELAEEMEQVRRSSIGGMRSITATRLLRWRYTASALDQDKREAERASEQWSDRYVRRGKQVTALEQCLAEVEHERDGGLARIEELEAKVKGHKEELIRLHETRRELSAELATLKQTLMVAVPDVVALVDVCIGLKERAKKNRKRGMPAAADHQETFAAALEAAQPLGESVVVTREEAAVLKRLRNGLGMSRMGSLYPGDFNDFETLAGLVERFPAAWLADGEVQGDE